MTESLPESEDLGFEEPGQGDPAQGESNDFEYLDPNERKQFVRAIEIGREFKTVDVMGHQVGLHTLSIGEELAIGSFIKEWEGTRAINKAYKVAIVACSIDTVDGEPFYKQIKEMSDAELLSVKFEKLKGYYSAFVDEVYNRVREMESEMIPLLEKLGKSKG